MKITGELLKSERTRKSLTIQDVAFALKLSPKIISAIEAGETESLPAKTFIRGFVKSYAQYLKIDVDQVMRQFQEEMGSTHPLPKNISSHHQPVEIHPKSSTETEFRSEPTPRKTSNTSQPTEQTKVLNESKKGRSFIYIGIAVFLVIAIVAINKIADRYQKESILNPQDISKVQPLNPVEPPTQAASTSTPENTDMNPASTTAAMEMATTTKPEMMSSTTNQPLQSTQSTTTPSSATASHAEVDDGFEPSSGKPVEIIVEAKKDTEILYARGNTKSFSRLKLSAKQIQVIRSTTGLHLKSEDGGSFHMVVNGVDKGPAGPQNKPVRLSF